MDRSRRTVREEEFEDALQNIDAWWARVCTPEGTQCNEQQLQFVAERVNGDFLRGPRERWTRHAWSAVPLRWDLHGGPGAGKSYALRCL